MSWHSIPSSSLPMVLSSYLKHHTYLSGTGPTSDDFLIFKALQPQKDTLKSLPHLHRWMSTIEVLSSPPPSPVDNSTLVARVDHLESLVKLVQNNFPNGHPTTQSVSRCEAALQAGFPGSALVQVPATYYSLTLPQRAALLSSPVTTLCKTLVFKSSVGTVVGDPGAPLPTQKYLAVILQYTSKIKLSVLEKLVAEGGGGKLGLAEEGREVTGFGFNGVTPVGSLTPLPIIVAKQVVDCGHPFIWLGGGEEDVKARVFLGPLLGTAGVRVLDVSEGRGEEEWGDE